MKRVSVLLFAGVLLACGSAAAQPWQHDKGGRRNFGPPDRGAGHRPGPMRPEPEGDGRRDGRMTQEERRELHRDLDRANREIYQRRPGPGGR